MMIMLYLHGFSGIIHIHHNTEGGIHTHREKLLLYINTVLADYTFLIQICKDKSNSKNSKKFIFKFQQHII